MKTIIEDIDPPDFASSELLPDKVKDLSPVSADAGWSARLLAQSSRIVIIFGITLAFCYFARIVVLPVVIAWVASLLLKPPVNWLRKIGAPTPLAALVVIILFVSAMGFGILTLGRPAAAWIQSAPENLPRLKEKFQKIMAPAAHLSAVATSVGNLGEPTKSNEPPPIKIADNHLTNSLFTWTWTFLAGVGETIALIFLLLASGDLFLHKIVHVMPTLRNKKQAVDISHEIQHSISRYLFSVALINLVFGTLVGLGLHFAGMPGAFMWGGVAAVANFVPYLGPIVGVSAVALTGLLAFDSVGRGLLPAIVYLAIHLVEANLATPFILGKRFTINPVIIFVTLIFFVWLWGVLGAVLAVPLLVALKVICERIPTLAPWGELLSGKD